jgi:hypothetical protein
MATKKKVAKRPPRKKQPGEIWRRRDSSFTQETTTTFVAAHIV